MMMLWWKRQPSHRLAQQLKKALFDKAATLTVFSTNTLRLDRQSLFSFRTVFFGGAPKARGWWRCRLFCFSPLASCKQLLLGLFVWSGCSPVTIPWGTAIHAAPR